MMAPFARSQGINLSVESIQSALKRVRAEIMEPYEAVRSRTIQLRNLHTTVGLLRHLIHHVKLAQVCRFLPPTSPRLPPRP